MKKLIILSILMLTTTLAINAQVRFEWKQYGLSFSVPDDFEIVENTEDSFEAGNGLVHLAIGVIDYDGIDVDTMGEILAGMAIDSGMRNPKVGELALTTLGGAYIEGRVDGVMTIFITLMDTDSNIALFASIVYEDGFERQANYICNSFKIK